MNQNFDGYRFQQLWQDHAQNNINDAYDEEHMTNINQIINEFSEETTFEVDTNFPNEIQPIKMSAQMYKDLFVGGTK